MKILRLHRVEYFVNDVEEAEANFSKLLNTKFIDHREQTRLFSVSFCTNEKIEPYQRVLHGGGALTQQSARR